MARVYHNRRSRNAEVLTCDRTTTHSAPCCSNSTVRVDRNAKSAHAIAGNVSDCASPEAHPAHRGTSREKFAMLVDQHRHPNRGPLRRRLDHFTRNSSSASPPSAFANSPLTSLAIGFSETAAQIFQSVVHEGCSFKSAAQKCRLMSIPERSRTPAACMARRLQNPPAGEHRTHPAVSSIIASR